MITAELLERSMSESVPEAGAVLHEVAIEYLDGVLEPDELTASLLLGDLSYQLLNPALRRLEPDDVDVCTRVLAVLDGLIDRLDWSWPEFEVVFLAWAESMVNTGTALRAAALAPARLRLILLERARAMGLHPDGQPVLKKQSLETAIQQMH